MTRRLSLKKAFIVSLCVHCVVAVFFCFTVGASPLCPAQRMFFSGELLGSGIVSEPPKGGGRGVLPVLRLPESAAPALVSGFSPAKPCSGVFLSQKKLPVQVVAAAGSSPVLREPVLFLHPQLPAQLELYFKDRQEVHIELLFSISPSQDKSVIER